MVSLVSTYGSSPNEAGDDQAGRNACGSKFPSSRTGSTYRSSFTLPAGPASEPLSTPVHHHARRVRPTLSHARPSLIPLRSRWQRIVIPRSVDQGTSCSPLGYTRTDVFTQDWVLFPITLVMVRVLCQFAAVRLTSMTVDPRGAASSLRDVAAEHTAEETTSERRKRAVRPPPPTSLIVALR